MEIPHHALAAVLRRTDIFANFTEAELDVLLPHFDLVGLQPGDSLFQEGDEGDAWFLVLDGVVSITATAKGGPPHELAQLEAGDSFGEMALIDGATRMASVTGVATTLLARLTRARFDSLLAAHTPTAWRLLRGMAGVLCQRQRELTTVLQDLVDLGQTPTNEESQALTDLYTRHLTWN